MSCSVTLTPHHTQRAPLFHTFQHTHKHKDTNNSILASKRVEDNNNNKETKKMPRKIQKKTKKKKKTKFLSLRHLNLNHTPAADEETVAEDFFAAAVEDTCGATLAALFGAVSPSDTAHESPLSCAGQDPTQDSGTLSPSLTCVPRDPFRGAMRGREEREDEKWVCYEEVTSCDAGVGAVKVHPTGLGLSLKLDYQEIIDAWCDKGSLYMPGPQTVPDLSDDFLNFRGGSDGFNDGWRSHGSLWTVPENTVGKEGVKVEQELEEELKLRHREASVLRYKEKRRNRLFSKRIRYEVRKINAEKRPRMKGRFVKRN